MATLNIIPTGDGALEEGTTEPSTTNAYSNIDDPVGSHDSAITRIYSPGPTKTNTFTFADISISGIISSVTIYAVFFRNIATSVTGEVLIRISSTNYYSTAFTMAIDTWELKSYEWAVNPATSAAWTVSDINGMEIGFRLQGDTSKSGTQCTQLYAVVTYTPSTPGGAACLMI